MIPEGNGDFGAAGDRPREWVPLHVVVADDDPIQAAFIVAVLDSLGHTSTVANDGYEALHAIEQSGASLLICDIEMPNLDGISVAYKVREIQFGRYIYVLLVTARNRRSDFENGLSAGADDFMTKPIDPVLLTVRLKAAQRLLQYQQEISVKNLRLAEAYEQIQEDLRAAGAVQIAMLPRHRLDVAGCGVYPLFMPSQHVSGDMYNFFEVGQGRLGFYAADVAGHGVRAALLAATLGYTVTAELFRNIVDHETAPLAPRRLAEELNRRFASEDPRSYFTLVAGVIDAPRRELVICQAGHPRPLVLRPSGKTEWLGEGGFPIGLYREMDWDDFRVDFGPGDRLIVYSDGVTEAMNPTRQAFGQERLSKLALECARWSPEETNRALAGALRHWRAAENLQDDISMIIFDYKPCR